MRKTFPGFYEPSVKELNSFWNDGIFVFDTNVLLGLYRYSPETSEQFIGILKAFSKADRLWLPNQIGVEYHKNRNEMTRDVNNAYAAAETILKKYFDQSKSELAKIKNRIHSDITQLTNNLEKAINDLIEELNQRKATHLTTLTTGGIDSEIESIFEGRIGEAFDVDRLLRVQGEGAKRYNAKIPPGFGDKEKKEMEQYGDLIIWFQILDYAEENKKPIVFVTSDREKGDWWTKVGDEYIGPRSELILEMKKKSMQPFWMYEPGSAFIEEATKRLNVAVSDDAKQEVEETQSALVEQSRNDMASELYPRYETASLIASYSSDWLAASQSMRSAAAITGTMLSQSMYSAATAIGEIMAGQSMQSIVASLRSSRLGDLDIDRDLITAITALRGGGELAISQADIRDLKAAVGVDLGQLQAQPLQRVAKKRNGVEVQKLIQDEEKEDKIVDEE